MHRTPNWTSVPSSEEPCASPLIVEPLLSTGTWRKVALRAVSTDRAGESSQIELAAKLDRGAGGYSAAVLVDPASSSYGAPRQPSESGFTFAACIELSTVLGRLRNAPSTVGRSWKNTEWWAAGWK